MTEIENLNSKQWISQSMEISKKMLRLSCGEKINVSLELEDKKDPEFDHVIIIQTRRKEINKPKENNEK